MSVSKPWRLTLCVAAISLAVLPCVILPAQLSSPAAAAPSGLSLYVAGYATPVLDVLDPASLVQTGQISLPISSDGLADAMAITPDGRTAYVADDFDGTLIPVDLATQTAGAPIQLVASPGRTANNFYSHDVAITPDGSTVYVTVAARNAVVPVNVATNTPGPAIKVGHGPVGIAITPSGKVAYVSNARDGTVTPISLAKRVPGRPIKIAPGNVCCNGGSAVAGAMAMAPDGKTVYVAGLGAFGITPISTATNKAGRLINLQVYPEGIAITPDGKRAYVATSPTTVTPIALAARKVGAPIKITGSSLRNFVVDVVVAPDGRTVYAMIANDGGVVPIVTATNKLGKAVAHLSAFRELAISPDESPVASVSVTPASHGAPTTFDASASVGTTSPIASYRWNFGDGATATTTNPTTAHVYATAKTYVATVTVTDSAGTSTRQVFTGRSMTRNGGPTAAATVHVFIP